MNCKSRFDNSSLNNSVYRGSYVASLTEKLLAPSAEWSTRRIVPMEFKTVTVSQPYENTVIN